MEIQVLEGAIQDVASELIVVSLFEGAVAPEGATEAVDQALGGAIHELIQAGDLTGKREETRVIYTRGGMPARRVLVVGLGPKAAFSLDVLRRAGAQSGRAIQDLGVSSFHSVVHGADAGGLDASAAAQALVEGTLLGLYQFRGRKTLAGEQQTPPEAMTLVAFGEVTAAAVEAGAMTGKAIAEAVCLARDLANQPANHMTPSHLAVLAQEMAKRLGLGCQVLDEDQMAGLGMGALLGVAQGTAEPAKFIILEHNAGRDDLPTYVVVGKGITFDSGGISLKPSGGMESMKYDMSGAAITLAVMRAVAALDLPLHVVGLVPATENLPGGRAYKPGDVLTSRSGLTIEVISTDAEGRLILADALDYAKQYAPKGVVDLATLTGACVTALGHVATGLMGNDPGLIADLKMAADEASERVWELPLYAEYDEQIKSDVADVKNSGGRPAGAITAGLFLSKFASGYPWAHLDIAGTAWADKADGYRVKGATGCCVRLLIQWLQDRTEKPS